LARRPAGLFLICALTPRPTETRGIPRIPIHCRGFRATSMQHVLEECWHCVLSENLIARQQATARQPQTPPCRRPSGWPALLDGPTYR
jgi:hypothetical protein